MSRPCIKPPTGHAAAAAAQHRAALPSFTTERLTLRIPTMEDYPVWRTVFAEEEHGNLGGPHPDEHVWEAFMCYIAGWLTHGHGTLAVTHKNTGQTLGFVLLGLEWGDEEPELGWLFPKSSHGHGYATEAAAALRAYGLTLFAANGFVSYIHETNPRSDAVATRLGASRDSAAEARFPGHHVWRHTE